MTDMTGETTARLGLPLLAPGQAQKEMSHNDALAMLDVMVPAVVEGVADVPPDAPLAGQAWGVGSTPAGAWTGHAGAVAGWTAAGWRFVGPIEGMTVWSRADAMPARWQATGWELGHLRGRAVLVDGVAVVGARRPAVADPAGGDVVDVKARAALAGVLDALRTHGLIVS